ncbi:hypothetical protein TNCV_4294761 [Trichonephila clavipes]|uniref:Uncharacterized protein n=1 Tax=Trichonephila clavipes TaxID=2585209 RepID=A0A8X6RL73_TRICX|nr:hypothetical protein TNCV_4294761 [Trichonephila clavipes]
MATGSYMTPIYSRSQSEVQGDLHRINEDYQDCSKTLTRALVTQPPANERGRWGFSERTLDAEVDDPGLRKIEQREQWPSRHPPPVVYKRDAYVSLNTQIPETIVKIECHQLY